jgi:hypothetical protein
MLLVVGCLLWWGDAAAASEQALLLEDWKKAVEDVGWVLGESTKGVKALYVTAFDVSTALANFGDSVKRLGEAESKAAKVIKENKKKAMEEDAGKATRGTVKRKVSSSMEKENAEVERPRFAESGFLPLRTDPPLRKRKRATR